MTPSWGEMLNYLERVYQTQGRDGLVKSAVSAMARWPDWRGGVIEGVIRFILISEMVRGWPSICRNEFKGETG